MVLSVALAEHDGFRVTSKMLAEGLGTNPSLIRKLLFPLSRDGLIRPSVGKGECWTDNDFHRHCKKHW